MKKKYRYAFIISIILIALAVLFINHKPLLIEKFIKDSGIFLNQLVAFSFNDDLKCETYNNEELENQITELKEALSINNILSDYENINCVVISHDVGYWYDKIIINKGSNEGIEEGMAVINSKGLIGKVISTTNFSSTVRLLTSEEMNKISIKIESDNNYVYGLIYGYKKDENIYVAEGISSLVTSGVKVTTTGFGDTFPAGIVVGEVVNSKNDAYDLAKTIEIKPSVDFNNLNIVSVLKRKV